MSTSAKDILLRKINHLPEEEVDNLCEYLLSLQINFLERGECVHIFITQLAIYALTELLDEAHSYKLN
jgi:hypothetical protein